MKIFLSLLALVLLSGCARYNIEPPLVDYTGQMEMVEPSVIKIEEIPKSPEARSVSVDGEKLVAFDLEGMNDLKAMRDQARKNTEILREILLANNSLIQERNNLLGLAKEIERRANKLAVEWADTEEQRRKAEDLRSLERNIYQILTLIGLALAL